jgi:hypothetical protein
LSRIEKFGFSGTGLIEIILPSSVEVLCESCFSECKSLFSVTFESGSRLSRIEKWAFYGTGLIEIIVPASVEVLGERCFQSANHFPQLHLNQGRGCLELKVRFSVKLAGFARINKGSNAAMI